MVFKPVEIDGIWNSRARHGTAVEIIKPAFTHQQAVFLLRGDDHPVDFPYGVAGGDDNHGWERVARRIGSQPARLVKRVSGVPSESDRACARHKLAVCADDMLGWRATGDVPASEFHAAVARANRQWAGRIVRDDSHAITPMRVRRAASCPR